jgi:hypothetical protein
MYFINVIIGDKNHELAFVDCCFSELALLKSNPAWWSSTKQTSSSSHWKLFCSSHSWKIAELAVKTTITHSSLDDDEVCFVLDHHAGLDFNSASSLKQQSADRHVAPLRHIILIPSKPVFALSQTTITHSSFCVLCPILTVSGLSNLDYLFHFSLMFIYLHALLLTLEHLK